MTAPRGRRNPAPRPGRAERRQHLLAAAAKLFAEQGFATTTTEQIAAAAGVKEATLLRHFPEKAAVFRAVLDELLSPLHQQFTSQPEPPPDPLARLLALTEGLRDGMRNHPVAVRAVIRALNEGDAEVRGVLAEIAQAWQDRLGGIISEGQQAGFFRRSLDPQVGAWHLIHAVVAVPLTRPLAMPLHAQPDYAARAIECVLHGLLKTDV